jgi:hypothetical protein
LQMKLHIVPNLTIRVYGFRARRHSASQTRVNAL